MKFIIKAVLFLLALHALVFVSFSASAEGKIHVLVSIGSYHFRPQDFPDEKLREFNPGLGIEYKINDNIYATAGAFINSFNEKTFYAAAGYIIGSETLKAGAELGYIKGYEKHPSACCYKEKLMIAPYLSIKDKYKIYVLYNALSLQLRF